MLALSRKWIRKLIAKPETGMGYHIVSVVLKDGRRFDQAIVDSGFITRIKGMDSIPFSEADISKIIVTHASWDFQNDSG